MTQNKPRAILTEEFRLSFCNLFEPKADMNGVVRFGAEMLFPKERGTGQFKEMLAIYNEALAKANFQGSPTPRTFKEAILDGDKKKQEGRHSMWMLRANSGPDFPPRLLLPNHKPATKGDIYEGCWCRAVLTAYPYEARKDGKGAVINRGASFNLLAVQKVRDDKPFSGFVSEEEIYNILASKPLEVEEVDDILA